MGKDEKLAAAAAQEPLKAAAARERRAAAAATRRGGSARQKEAGSSGWEDRGGAAVPEQRGLRHAVAEHMGEQSGVGICSTKPLEQNSLNLRLVDRKLYV